MKKKIVFLTGAGMSAESGISTFRDTGGLWDKYPVMEVCSADGFARNPALVHEFYNTRRRELLSVSPNSGHRAIAALEDRYDVYVVTQNVDNLHERAGSSKVLHLHGELMKVRSIDHPERIYELTPDNIDTTPDTRDSHGDKVRPHIVFFQEAVPMLEPAIDIVAQADTLVIIGTSLNVYPAAGLIRHARPGATVYYIDPAPAPVAASIKVLQMTATAGMAELTRELTGQ
ncbi:MAG: NAD-dependent deacylase [Muribaculaceae bacterium]|nr:NAD-dependent deacylase [Muribaculaceae bacterium]